MKIQTSIVIMLSLAWSVRSSPPEAKPEVMGNLRKAATTNILKTSKKSDSRKTSAEFGLLKLEPLEARLSTLYQLQKNEADLIRANLFQLHDTNSGRELPDYTDNIKTGEVQTIRTDALRWDGVKFGGIPQLCQQDLDGGWGQNVVFRWYFNVARTRCEGFFYNGYGGNDNRFESLKECKDTCAFG